MDNVNGSEYKIYKWNVHDLKMYACGNVKFRKKEKLGQCRVSGVYRTAI